MTSIRTVVTPAASGTDFLRMPLARALAPARARGKWAVVKKKPEASGQSPPKLVATNRTTDGGGSQQSDAMANAGGQLSVTSEQSETRGQGQRPGGVTSYR